MISKAHAQKLPAPTHASQLTSEFGEVLVARISGRASRHFASGLTTLDENLPGWLSPGRLIVVAGRPQMGKTAFAQQIAEHVADQKPSLIYSLETCAHDIITRSIARRARVDLDYLQAAKGFSKETMQRIIAACSAVGESRLYVYDSIHDIDSIVASARVAHKEHGGLGAIVVDYVQLIEAEGTNQNARIGAASRNLKILAQELDVPVIALAQLNRGVELRDDKRPVLSDLRDSGCIEQDADLVLLLYRDEYYRPGKNQGTAELICGKNKHGRRRATLLRFDERFGEFGSGGDVCNG